MVIANHQLNNDMLPQVDPLSVNGRDLPMSICQCRSIQESQVSWVRLDAVNYSQLRPPMAMLHSLV